MIDLVWFNDFICVHRNGDVERILRGTNQFGKAGEKIFIANAANCLDAYNYINVGGKSIPRHRLVAHCFQNLTLKSYKDKVDHVDRNPLNNSNENLRIVTNQQNQFNTVARGTSYVPLCRKKWQARIALNGKTIYLGTFPTEAEAHETYLDAKLIYHVI